MSGRLTILFIPINMSGHLNPMIGFGQLLVSKHRVIFAVSQKIKGNLIKYGFEEEVYEVNDPFLNMDKNAYKKHVQNKIVFQNKPPIEKKKEIVEDEFFLKMAKSINPLVKPIVHKIQPDLVILDSILTLPSAIKDYPWINIIASNPNLFYDERAPPSGLGLSANDPNSWKQYHEELNCILSGLFKKFNDWYEQQGIPRNPNKYQWFYHSPYLNIYQFPKELDYIDLRPNPPNWVRIDTLMIKSNEQFVIPEKLKNKPGKLIYFSLGSLSSINIELMKNLINYLSSSPHRFIISKGMFGDDYDLPENCWGDNYVPQKAVLKIVDLAIIHGGNNSLCEAFYYGKPMIVMPIFADQPDNAQRVHEKRFGIRLNPHTCSEKELLNAIENVLNDQELHQKIELISNRIKNSSNHSNQIIERIQHIAVKSKVKQL